jgi:hypothetical protein
MALFTAAHIVVGLSAEEAQMAGYSGTPLVKKLGIKEGHRLAVLGDPGHLADLLGKLPSGVRRVDDPPLPRSRRAGHPAAFDVVIAFVPEASHLERRFRKAHRLLTWTGGLWLSWPKMKSALFTDLREGTIRAHGLESGLVDNKVCAVDDDWSGLRFVYRVADRP